MRKTVVLVVLTLTWAAIGLADRAQDARQLVSGDIRPASPQAPVSALAPAPEPDARGARLTVAARSDLDTAALKKKARPAPQRTPAARDSPPAGKVRTTLEERIAAAQQGQAAATAPSDLPTVKLVPPAAAKGALGPAQAASRYVDGLMEEGRGELKRAHLAFLEAAEGGHGPAQKKLGQLYDKGNAAVRRDYAESLRWYQRAREQGEIVPQPLTARNATSVR